MNMGSIVDDVDALRKTMKNGWNAFRKEKVDGNTDAATATSGDSDFPTSPTQTSPAKKKTIPGSGGTDGTAGNSTVTEDLVDLGVMVLPIEWRTKLRFDSWSAEKEPHESLKSGDEDLPSVKHITLDTVASLRNIISDVLLDGMSS